jgi:type 1 glutamine amidotransferase
MAIVALMAMGLFAEQTNGDDYRVLVFSKTVGFRHNSIADGISLIQQLGIANNFGVDLTEDASDFNQVTLAQYAVVVWLSTTGDVLNSAQQSAFEAYIQSGGGYVGVHAAADCEYGWPWYGQLLGGDAWFDNHPSIQTATLSRADDDHVSSRHFPATFSFQDEWYNFQNQPTTDADVNVMLTIDETTYSGGDMGSFHPMAWYHAFDGGRAWYTALGHRSQTFGDVDFQKHLLGGILWAAKCLPEDSELFNACLTGPEIPSPDTTPCRCADHDDDMDVDLEDYAAVQEAR